MNLLLQLLLATALASGAEQRLYLVHSAAPVAVETTGGAVLYRRFDERDGAGGTRSTLVLHLPCGGRATIRDGAQVQEVGRWCVWLPRISQAEGRRWVVWLPRIE